MCDHLVGHCIVPRKALKSSIKVEAKAAKESLDKLAPPKQENIDIQIWIKSIVINLS